MGEFAIGQGVPRFEDPRLLRGGGKYVDDVTLPGMAFGHVKLRHLAAAKADEAALLEQFRSGPPALLKAAE